MSYDSFFMALAFVVLTAIAGGWLASRAATIRASLTVCLLLGAVLAAIILFLAQSVQTDGFIGLIVIATFMFSSVIAFSASLVMRRVRDRRHHPHA